MFDMTEMITAMIDEPLNDVKKKIREISEPEEEGYDLTQNRGGLQMTTA
jgi:hypothetical protein